MKPGDEWGTPTDEHPLATVRGADSDLAAAVARATDRERSAPPLFEFEPTDSDLARAVGLGAPRRHPGGAARVALPLDALRIDAGTDRADGADGRLAVNLVISGRPPGQQRPWHRRSPVQVVVDGRTVHDGPALAVVAANGQFHAGLDVVPRGHPGDGRMEVHVYALRAGERGAMRRRLPTGSHVPHPRIRTTTGRAVSVRWKDPVPLVVDGQALDPAARFEVTLRPGAYRLLV